MIHVFSKLKHKYTHEYVSIGGTQLPTNLRELILNFIH